MKKLTIIIIFVFILLTAIGIYFYFNSNVRIGEVYPLQRCLNAGELAFDESTGVNRGECCEGLVKIGDVFYDSNKTCEEIFRIVGYGSICSDCGNKICESWENRCNCPEDCK